MNNYICIHAHFYQPPRENPWLEAIELQDSAHPYHDWNERVDAECYAPNAAARILDDRGHITEIVNNYARLSFNIGPTLMAWLEPNDPETYAAILAADRESQARFSGHGSALAQVYNHMILPLATPRDKRTQVRWGIRDFERRFGRSPEGMWLPETAVDGESLQILAEEGIRFTVLAPHQARRVRRRAGGDWQDVSAGRVDPTRAYAYKLPGGKSLAIFFYDGPISRAIAFEGLLARGDHFANRLLGAISEDRTWPQLISIATDGETYGHHHRYGEMALAYALKLIEDNDRARLTNYGEFLEKFPPAYEVEIFEDTSWSCVHGVERWRADCGCNTGGHAHWNQAWRGPLRHALDWLRQELSQRYEAEAARLFTDPWGARDRYIEVILDRSEEQVQRFFARECDEALESQSAVQALRLLELQRHAMLMYTSCGWFFDELSGLESVQVLQYAARALQLGQALFDIDLEAGFLKLLAQARSNLAQWGDGRGVYASLVRPAMVDLTRVGAHYAVSSAFEDYGDQERIFSYRVDRDDFRRQHAGRATLALGRICVTSEITWESTRLSFGVLHLGDHNVTGGTSLALDEEEYARMLDDVGQPFSRADFPEALRALDEHLGKDNFSLRSLFRDERRRLLNRILEAYLADAEIAYGRIYHEHAPLMRFLADMGIPLPQAFRVAAEFVVNHGLSQAFSPDNGDIARAKTLLEEARLQSLRLNESELGYALSEALERAANAFAAAPDQLERLAAFDELVGLVSQVPFGVDLWRAQNSYYELAKRVLPGYQASQSHDASAEEWVKSFKALGEKLSVRVD